MEKMVKDPQKVLLFHYEDPIMGPRTIPSFSEPLTGKVEVKESKKFTIDLEKNDVLYDKKSFGKHLIYRVNN
jgi:hypothetical protein